MTDDSSTLPPTDSSRTVPRYTAGFDRLADHWGLVLAYGLVTLGLGIVLAVWPDETLLVCAVLIAIQLLISGVFRIVTAIAASGLDTALRVLSGLTGALALIVGLLFLRDPLQTVLVIGLILGAWWVATGVIDIIAALVAGTAGRVGWDIAGGVVSILVGGFLLVNPELSLGVLVFVICVWLIAVGLMAVVAALRLRAVARHASTRAVVPPAPAT
ncbi:MAG TPA: HdeD family acid-resistance protein [Nocardioides sp.]|nr:HdeD family acid-resistance protein [Nocardioides sp.]